ncbi:MAG: dihydroorotate dehydrogenase [Candidatus Diapherotrites archaeon]|nr:dihydroorotate dehydrogenase [Candidatus Diapherotrites archaeon]
MLEVDLCNLRLKNPTILASGILGVSRELLQRVSDSGAGAATIKSITLNPREGHHNPTIIGFEAGIMNAVGYSNAGIEEAKKEFADLSGIKIPIIASIVAEKPEEFALLAGEIDSLHQFSAIELPLSCPHTPGFGLLAGQGTPEATSAITNAVREKTRLPIFVKLSPNVPGIGELAKSAEKAGASAITAVNTLGPGMLIDINSRKPVLDFKCGGISGPALRPVAVRCVYDVYESVKIPIIGVGGILTGRDAIEMILAGATAIGIGSGIYYRGMNIFAQVCREMEMWMKKNKVKSLEEIRGQAHA